MSKKAFIAALAACLLSFPSISARAQGWLELPASAASRGSCLVLRQDMQQDGRTIRSHTYLYDPSLRVSRWVAYPLNKGLIGEGSRGDGWHPSTLLSESSQAVLRKGFAYGSGYDRGHQIPSADRLESRINDETFVYINATPQDHDFNGGIWADLEKLVRTWAKRSDTLYVVTGIVPGKEWIADNDGNKVNIPAAYYKTVLRKNTDRYGKVRWSMCAALIPHDAFSHPDWTWSQKLTDLRGYAVSVSRLQEVTGDVFFPNFEKVVGKKAVEQMRKEDPAATDWWWK